MKACEFTKNDVVEVDRSSRRFKGDVEIIERETIKMIKVKDDQSAAFSKPRLVIGDAVSTAKLFIAKARSELVELDSFLREIAGPQRQVK